MSADDRSPAAPLPGGDEADQGDAAAERILRVDVWATGIFVVVAVLAAIVPRPMLVLAVPLELVLFVAGSAAFLWAYAVAVSRSQYEVVTMGGVFFPGNDVIPARAVRILRLALAVQVVVAIAVAAARPFTAAAFAVLVPMLGLGLMALYGARFGRFAVKSDDGLNDGTDVEPETGEPDRDGPDSG